MVRKFIVTAEEENKWVIVGFAKSWIDPIKSSERKQTNKIFSFSSSQA